MKSTKWWCYGLQNIIIPNSVTNIKKYAILDCAEVTVYVEVKEKPEGWHEDWHYNLWGWKEESIVWGYKKKK